jgi:hypothetical protein
MRIASPGEASKRIDRRGRVKLGLSRPCYKLSWVDRFCTPRIGPPQQEGRLEDRMGVKHVPVLKGHLKLPAIGVSLSVDKISLIIS